MTKEQKHASDKTQSLDDQVTVLVLAALGQTSVDNVSVVRLQANVQKSQQG